MKTLSQLADEHEDKMARELDRMVMKSTIYTSGEVDPSLPKAPPRKEDAGRHYLMSEDPRLKPMPAAPTLQDFFKLRFGPAAHLLQSARLAMKNGLDEKIVLACLLHDIAVFGFIRSDHGYWGAQLLEPYVDEEVAWAIRAHQSLRFFPDESVGYEYPETYIRMFGKDYAPDPWVAAEYERNRAHRWYMSARLVTLNDLYSFDPAVTVDIEEFTDIIGRNFKQPKEGLGRDNTASTHMWRTIIAPTKFL
jgi:hypothetical protein